MTRFLELLLTALIVWLIVPAPSASAQEGQPSREPILRIETGMHTAAILRIGLDAANRFLVTASHDKTVRVWELPSGRLLRIIRMPVGAGSDGKLYAVALSPDGMTIAASGFTSGVGEPTNLYFFDRASGRLIRRLGGLPDVVNHLVYSPDGQYLAAMLGGKSGLRVYRTRDYSLTGEDRNYGGQSYGGDFDRAGRLVAACYDGFIRLYTIDSSLRLLAKRNAVGGERPFDVKFSPDGSRIAVGFDDSMKVAVLQGSDLAPLYTPDTTGVNNSTVNSVAWSADGRTLYAGGRYSDADNNKFIRAWADAGRGGYRDIAGVAVNTILHILPLRDGGIIYCAADPAFGVIDASGRRQLFTAAAIADYRNTQQGFLLSPDGMGVRFAYQQYGRSPARFSITDRRLDHSPAGSMSWRPPETEDSNLRVTDWTNTYTPKLNGTLLKLEEYEISRSLAFAPDRSAFLLGADWHLRLFDRNGAERWQVSTPAAAWALNISSDGKLAVSAYGDGTIRWYRMTDGKELLAFFPHNDRKRWILWTPSGYYDASPGAEDLIGWHVNNGRDAAADFFPVGQFRSIYYRPDVIAKVLQTGDETRALALANEEAGRQRQAADVSRMLPPVVEIISPLDSTAVSTTEVTVRFRVRTPSGEPVTKLRVLVDGRPASTAKEVVQQGTEADTREIRVTVPERDSEVSILAENRFAPSVPATVRLRWQSRLPQLDSLGEVTIRPRLFILAVGVSRYANESYNLQFADKDANDFVRAMMAQKGVQYRDVVVYHDKAITNDLATKEEIEDGLDWIRNQTMSDDVAMVFFSGHGVNDRSNYYFFCPYNINVAALLRTGVPFSDIKNAVSAVKGKVLFFIDSCHSGNSLGLAGRRDINGLINDLSSAPNGVVVISATTSGELAYERAEWNNGAFTKAVVEALNGAAADLRRRITFPLLYGYVADRVEELTGNQQHPALGAQAMTNFPIAVKRSKSN